MKKNIVSFGVLIGVSIALVACSPTNDAADVSEYSNVHSKETYKELFTEQKGDRETSKELSTEQKADKEKNSYVIYEGTDFSEGVALVEAENNGNIFVALINTSGEILLKLENCSDINELSKVTNGIFVYNNNIYNTRGEIIASPHENGYTEIAVGYNHIETVSDVNKAGYVIVTKHEESYKGDKILFGVINNKGEYEVNLSENGSLNLGNFEYKWENGYLEIFKHWYVSEDVSDDIHYFNSYRTVILERKTGGVGDVVILWDFCADFLFDSAFLGKQLIWSEEANRYIAQETNLYDYNGNIIIDLSQYITEYNSFREIAYYDDEYLLLTADNGNGHRYLFLIKKNGDLAFEPMKVEYSDSIEMYNWGFSIKNIYGNEYFDFDGRCINFSYAEPKGQTAEGLILATHSNGQTVYMNQSGNVTLTEIFE